MDLREVLFWAAAFCVAYPYFLYPLAIGVLAHLRPRPVRRGRAARSVSIIVAAYNEAVHLERRLRELCRILAESGLTGEIIVASDGSTDATAHIAHRFAGQGVRLVELPTNQGKAAALTAGCQAARYDILVFADARQTWAPDALLRLLENFADPQVGAASGDLVLARGDGVVDGVGLYWRYEKWLRVREGLVHSTVGVSGSISAVRRELFHGIPTGTLLDDVYWPLRVVMQGYRVVHDDRARAFDRLPDRARDEFRRKVRTLSGNFQLLGRLPAVLLPWRNPVWVPFVSHKLARLAVPWALLVLLVTSALLDRSFYRFALGAQVGFYFFGLLGARQGVGARLRLSSVAASYLMLNGAAGVAFWVWLTGRAERSWRKVTYRSAA